MAKFAFKVGDEVAVTWFTSTPARCKVVEIVSNHASGRVRLDKFGEFTMKGEPVGMTRVKFKHYRAVPWTAEHDRCMRVAACRRLVDEMSQLKFGFSDDEVVELADFVAALIARRPV